MGQNRLLRARRPIEAVLEDPATPAEIRERLLLVLQVREFAIELGLDVGEQYTGFAAWPGDRVVTAVVAARPGAVTPAGFRFLLFGELPYKGFFDRGRAERESGALRADGFDVCEVGVSAYSTLGWMDDPVTEPMLLEEPGQLVEVLLHELVHATVYLKGHATFNESIASFIGEEGSVRFYESRHQPERAHRRRLEIEDARRVDAALLRFRGEVSALYASQDSGTNRDEIRRDLETRARRRIRELPLRPTDYVRRQIRVTPYPTEDVGRLIERCGPDLFMFSSDYPHVEGGRNPLKRFEASLAGRSPAERDAFYAGNFADLLGCYAP